MLHDPVFGGRPPSRLVPWLSWSLHDTEREGGLRGYTLTIGGGFAAGF